MANIKVLKEEYEAEKQTVPDFKIQSSVYEHLQSFDNFLNWKARNAELFTQDDNAKNLI